MRVNRTFLLSNTLRTVRLDALLQAMQNEEFMNKRRILANDFENVCERLLSGAQLDLYEEKVSSMFEVIAALLFARTPHREFCWYDGVEGLTASVRKSRQIEFTGQMWVDDKKTQRKEDFRATVTDKRVTKQGIWITVWIGTDRAEGEMLAAFGIFE